MSAALLEPRRIARDTLMHLNALSLPRRALQFEWADAPWALQFTSCQLPQPDLANIEIEWGGARGVLRAERSFLEHLAGQVAGCVVTPSTPELILRAMLEAAFLDAAALVEKSTRKPTRLVSFVDSALLPVQLVGVSWQLESANACWRGELWLDLLGLGFLAAASRSLHEPQPLDFEGLPFRLQFLLGWTDLDWQAIGELSPRDVLLLDECFLRESNEFTVRTGKHAFSVAMEDKTLRVTEGWRILMDQATETEQFDDTDHDSVEAASLTDIPVRLTFDVGERTMTLAELRAIAPGHTFELGRDLRRAVTIRANGLPIGEGELVNVDGHVGVSVLTLASVPRQAS